MSDLIPLAQAHCVPRSGHEHRLGQARIAELMPQVPGWELAEEGRALVRTFRFKDYHRTMAFVNGLPMNVAFSGMSPGSGLMRPLAMTISICGQRSAT